MGHKIAAAIIENGRITYVDRKLPDGKIKVHLIYDIEEEPARECEVTGIVRETAGIYENINIKDESHKLRNEWNRNLVTRDINDFKAIQGIEVVNPFV